LLLAISPIGEAQTNGDVNLNRLTEAVSAINDNRLLRAEAILIPISAILRRGCRSTQLKEVAYPANDSSSTRRLGIPAEVLIGGSVAA